MNDETNKILHEFLGECVHRGVQLDSRIPIECWKCGTEVMCEGDGSPWSPPYYTADLNAVAEVEFAVIEQFGWDAYYSRLFHLGRDIRLGDDIKTKHFLCTAPASVRAEACRAVIEAR